jgi:glycosyltransferase involved in cell wall biosynthesis
MKPTVSLCMIVRNEEANLAECLACVDGLFDECIVVDTGSTDATKAVAERLGARIFDFTWVDDFAAARNESRRHATGEWVFWLDADDRIDAVNRQRLGALIGRLGTFDVGRNPVFMVSCLSQKPGEAKDFRMSQARLFARGANLHWVGAVHERIECVTDDVITVHATDVEIRHLGYQDPTEFARKQFRDLCLLERQYLVNPDDPLTLFYLARIHHSQGRYAEAVRLARRGIKLDPNKTILSTPQMFLILAESLMASGRIADALAACDNGAARYPDDPYLTHKRGCLLVHAGRLSEAEACFRKVLSQGQQAICFNSTPDDLNGETTWLMLARVYLMQRRWADADLGLRQCIKMHPGCVEAWELLAHANLAMARAHEVRGVIQRLVSMPGTELEQLLLQARLGIAEGQLSEARRWLDQAMRLRPDAPAPWVVLSDLLFAEGGDRQRCINVHRKALAMQPNLADLRQRLEWMLDQEATFETEFSSKRTGAIASPGR